MTKLLQIDNAPFSFRLATESDISSIVQLVESAYRGDLSKQGWTTESDFIKGQRTDAKEVSEHITAADSVIILCFDHDQLVASVQIKKSNQQAWLGMFAVTPERQSAGIGRLVIRQAEHYAQQMWHSKSMMMLVITIRTELIQWYLRLGYKRTGIVKPFPYSEPRFGLPQRDDLVLEVLEKSL